MASNSNVYVGSGVLTDLQNNLKSLSDSLENLFQTMVEQMNSVSTFWQDAKYEEFKAGYSGHIAKCHDIANNYNSWATEVLQNTINRVVEVEKTDVSGSSIGGGGGTTEGGFVEAGTVTAVGVPGTAAMSVAGSMSGLFNMGAKKTNSFPKSDASDAQAKWEEENQMCLDTETYHINENGKAVLRPKFDANEEKSLGSVSVEGGTTDRNSGSASPSTEAKIIANAVLEGRAKEAQKSSAGSTPNIESWMKEKLEPMAPNPTKEQGAMISKMFNDEKTKESNPIATNIDNQSVKGSAGEDDPATIIANAVLEGRAKEAQKSSAGSTPNIESWMKEKLDPMAPNPTKEQGAMISKMLNDEKTKESTSTSTNMGGQENRHVSFSEPAEEGTATIGSNIANNAPYSQPTGCADNTIINNSESNNITINNVAEKNTTINNQNSYSQNEVVSQFSGSEENNNSVNVIQPSLSNSNDTEALSVGNKMKDHATPISDAGVKELSYVPFPKTSGAVTPEGNNMTGNTTSTPAGSVKELEYVPFPETSSKEVNSGGFVVGEISSSQVPIGTSSNSQALQRIRPIPIRTKPPRKSPRKIQEIKNQLNINRRKDRFNR